MKPVNDRVCHEERSEGSDAREDVFDEAQVAGGDGLGHSEFVGGADALVHVEEGPQQRGIKGRGIDHGQLARRSSGGDLCHLELEC